MHAQNVHRGLVWNGQKLKTTQISMNSNMDQWIAIYLWGEVLYNNEKKLMFLSNDMNASYVCNVGQENKICYERI